MPTLLTIAGFDPSSGAGVTADLMTFAAHGCFGTACITALTVQSTVGVRSVTPVSADLVRQTLECLQQDLPPAGIKIGMMCNAPIASAVADFLESMHDPRIPVVLDPVVRSSSGRELLTKDAIHILRSRILPRVHWVTPNLDELAILSGRDSLARSEILVAGLDLQSHVPGLNLLITGGHMEPPDDLLLVASSEPRWISGSRIESRSTHGTGCAHSSAFLARLAFGDSAQAAAQAAKGYVSQAIRSAPDLGFGNGPLDHLWPRPLPLKTF